MDLVFVRKGFFAACLTLTMNIVNALPISGVLEFAGVFTPVQQQGGAIAGFNKVRVSYASGDFASWLSIGQSTNMAGVDLSNYPAVWNVGGVGINLANGVFIDDGDLPIDLAGLGFVNYQGYDQTNIKWSFSETTLTSRNSLFTFRLETVEDEVEVTEPSTLGLFGLGVLACGLLRRRLN
jgi:hypothetical protein